MVDPVNINVRRVPVLGKVIYGAGQVYEIVTQPCTPNPNIVIKAFFANIPMILWSIVKPDPVDFLTERFGRGHHRRRKRRWEIDKIDIGTPSGKGGHLRWAAFAGTQLQQRIGWYFLIVDATADFVINWTSMAYRFSGCQEPDSGYGSARRTVATEYFHDNTALQVTYNTWSMNGPFIASAADVRALLPGPRIVTATLRCGLPSLVPAATISRIWLETNRGGIPEINEMTLNDPGRPGPQVATIALPVYNLFEFPANYKLWVQSSDTGWIRWDEASLQISGFVNPGIQPDP